LRFLRATNGNIAVILALALPIVMAAAGAAVDMQRWGAQRARLQEFADTLALRGAREFMLANAQPTHVKALVLSTANGELSEQMQIGEFAISVAVDKDDASVNVSLTQPPMKALILSHFSPYGDQLDVDAVAVARGGMNVCVIALEENQTGAVMLDGKAKLHARGCSVLSNSAAAHGVETKKKSELQASLICSAGGWGGDGSYSPLPTSDCPVYPDPLASRTPPPVGGCDHQNFEAGYVKAQSANKKKGVGGLLGGVTDVVEETSEIIGIPLLEIIMHPGVYCGGINVKYNARVIFMPGVYVVKDGPLTIGKHSELRGRNVAFHLIGKDAAFTFDKDAKVTLTAPKDGPLAGILFFEDRDAPEGRVHAIYSEDARELLGTFYLSRGTLRVDTEKPVADASAYTAIVVRKLELKGGPSLVLNSDYHATDIPVPSGIGPVGREVFLRQ